MSLADKTPPARIHGKPCSIGTALAALPPAEAAALQAMLDDRANWPGRAIHTALNDEGITYVGRQTIDKHRRGDCRCAKEGT